ncbi:hypothetical protein H6F93_01680 [Leptolyngbya sp. FACHB-671]|nr:hypothetical protein [Leptolyngbya sp. FACHB-671]
MSANAEGRDRVTTSMNAIALLLLQLFVSRAYSDHVAAYDSFASLNPITVAKHSDEMV